jgi:hypothetical protein
VYVLSGLYGRFRLEESVISPFTEDAVKFMNMVVLNEDYYVI